jgi:hypothetical protein
VLETAALQALQARRAQRAVVPVWQAALKAVR